MKRADGKGAVVLGLAAAAALLASGLIESAPEQAARKPNRFAGNPAAVRAGAKLFGRECAGCHGSQREGTSAAPSLRGSRIHEAPPGALFWVIRNGSVFQGMPSFAHLPEPQIWQIVTYLQAAGDASPPAK